MSVFNVPIAAFGFLASRREAVSFSRDRLLRRSWTSSSLLKEKTATTSLIYTDRETKDHAPLQVFPNKT